jgi:aerobic C4-dicarboxylate transport protein
MTTSTTASDTGRARKPWYKDLTVQVLVGMALGVAVGALAPDIGRTLNPLGDIFIHLIQMVVGLIIFCTVTHGSPACAIWAR